MKCISIPIAMLLAATPAFLTAQELAADSVPPPSAVMPPPNPDPEAQAAQIATELKASKDVHGSDITVFTHAGTIMLTGAVNSEAERTAANSIAEKAAHGIRVSNSIEIRAVEDRPVKDQQVADQKTQLVRNVEAALKADERTANLGVAVSSNDGKLILLQGLVPSKENRTLVQSVVSKVEGVTRVENRLMVP
ncbi:MAG: BON domain-containing protein [Steroidobacteraceae bacterium]